MSTKPLSKQRKCDLIRFIRSNAKTKDQRMLRREGLKPLEISHCNAYRFTKQQLLDKAYRLNGNGNGQKTPIKQKKDKKLWEMGFQEYFLTRTYYPAYEKASRSQGTGQKSAVSLQKRARDSHANLVKKAILRGEDVPQTVINDHYYLKRDLEKLRTERQPESKAKRETVENCTRDACWGESIRYRHPSVPEGRRSEFETRYKIIEAKDALTSHRPEKGYSARPGYPKGVQDRDYSAPGGQDQIAVIQNAKNLDPDLILVRSVSASEGSPIVDEKNYVISGNSRAMAIFEASRNHQQKYQDYKSELYNRAREFGLSKAVIDRFTTPLLVREVKLPNQKELALFASFANKPISRALDSIGKSLELAKVLEAEADIASAITLQEGESLREFLTTAKGKRFTEFLNLNTSPTERAAYFRSNGALTETGKTVLEDALFATVFDDRKTLQSMSQSLRRALESSLPELIRIQQARTAGRIENEDNLVNALKWAIDFIASNPDFSENTADWARQIAFTAKGKLGHGLNKIAIELLTQFGNKPRALRDRITKYLKAVVDERAESALFQVKARSGEEILLQLTRGEGGAASGALFGKRKMIRSTRRRR